MHLISYKEEFRSKYFPEFMFIPPTTYIPLYFRYHTSSGVLVINSGLKPYTITRLPLGNITLEARVSDFMNASAIERFQVQVMYLRDHLSLYL